MLLKTDRLIIRNFKISDADDYLLNIGSNKLVAQYMLYPLITTIEEARDMINYFIEQDSFKNYHNYAIEYDNRVIGTIGINVNKKHKFVELSYNLCDLYWGLGFMSEALRSFINYIFNELDIECIYVEVMSSNERSINLLNKFNFNLDGCVRGKYSNRYGKRVNVNVYTLLKEENF